VILKDLFDAGRIGLAAGMYSVASGEVEFFETQLHETTAEPPPALKVPS
jgi:hypothetical protein